MKNVRGTRDILPPESIIRKEIIDIIRRTYEEFGFLPMETPALEKWEVLSKKGAGGSEVLEESFKFKDRKGREIGLRYDMTVPLARFISENRSIVLPFKRYQIDRVWRYGDVTRGRLREFWQADIDVIGSKEIEADAEVVSCAVVAMRRLGFRKFFVRINNRKVLNDIMNYAGVSESKRLDVIRTIDKLDKIGEKGVEEELKKIIEIDVVKRLMKVLKISGKDVLKKVGTIIGNTEGLKELKKLSEILNMIGISEYKIDLSLARGLDYYTGPIFEIFAEEGVGSVGGGGRYDNLIELFSGRKMPATGISLGIERIFEVLKDKFKVKDNIKVYVAIANEEVRVEGMKITLLLRENGVACDIDLMKRKLNKQLEYAGKMKIPYVLIIGLNDLKKNIVTLRDMSSGKERKIRLDDVINELKKL